VYHWLVFLCISLLFILDAMSRGYMSYISSYRCTYHSVILLWYIWSMSGRDHFQRVWPIGTKDQCLGYMYSEPVYHVTLHSWWWGLISPELFCGVKYSYWQIANLGKLFRLLRFSRLNSRGQFICYRYVPHATSFSCWHLSLYCIILIVSYVSYRL
jgi:hypothetical protein